MFRSKNNVAPSDKLASQTGLPLHHYVRLSRFQLLQALTNNDYMEENRSPSYSIGTALIVWIAAFAASFEIFLLISGTTGLALVFSVFVALIAFDLTRRSIRTGLVIFGLSLFIVLLQGAFYLFQ